MSKRAPVSLSAACALSMSILVAGVGTAAAATQDPAQPAPPSETAVEPPAPPDATAAPGATMVASPVAAEGDTDHDTVVGRWGIEARSLGTFQRTLGQEQGCETDCPVSLNALSVRRWSTQRYAWGAGLALAVGGGSARTGGTTRTWDTFFGIGPTVSANFLLANWKHLAVSLSPQLDLVFFLPSGKGSKSFLTNLRGVVEGEVHLGMIGLPQASVGISSGLLFSFLLATEDKKRANPGATATDWSIGITGPTALWDLVTKAFLRYYF